MYMYINVLAYKYIHVNIRMHKQSHMHMNLTQTEMHRSVICIVNIYLNPRIIYTKSQIGNRNDVCIRFSYNY